MPKAVDLDYIIKELNSGLSLRQQKVLEQRFAFKGGEEKTLAAIGGKYGITRERVRQIEAAALKTLKARAAIMAKDFVSGVKDELAETGGVMRADSLVQKFPYSNAASKIFFILSVYGEPYFYRSDNNWHDFWHADAAAKEKAFDFIKKMEERLSARQVEAILPDFQKDKHAATCVSISKKVGYNIYGDFGLRSWPEINPKTIRDKAYLVLKKHREPLHFRDLTERIAKLKLNNRLVNAQTVHNELIKDNRFVLVGRGIYGLQEYGFQPGTAREVIARLMKSNGPLHSHEVVALVKKEKFLKDNTILLNLQNKRYFRRMPDGRYSLIKEA
ncbi:MAG: sigma factor-like helix-turn-helix DNA-binding protein [Patescibacteria group bacterium]|mgnify:CR=1 FL=1